MTDTPTIPTRLLRFDPADWTDATRGGAPSRWALMDAYWRARDQWQRDHGLDSEAMDALSRLQCAQATKD